MRQQEFDRFRDFAERMCKHARPNKTPNRLRRLWYEIERFIDTHRDYSFRGWSEGDYLCDCVADYFSEYGDHIYNPKREEYDQNPVKFYNMLKTVLRSAINVTFPDVPDGGVIGFTVGDIRRMYDGEIPDWFADLYQNPKAIKMAPDDYSIWL